MDVPPILNITEGKVWCHSLINLKNMLIGKMLWHKRNKTCLVMLLLKNNWLWEVWEVPLFLLQSYYTTPALFLWWELIPTLYANICHLCEWDHPLIWLKLSDVWKWGQMWEAFLTMMIETFAVTACHPYGVGERNLRSHRIETHFSNKNTVMPYKLQESNVQPYFASIPHSGTVKKKKKNNSGTSDHCI